MATTNNNTPVTRAANDVASGDLIKLFGALKQNVFRTLSVARAAKVKSVTEITGSPATYKCVDIADPNVTIVAYALVMTKAEADGDKYKVTPYNPAVGDTVLVIFTDNDFRAPIKSTSTATALGTDTGAATQDKHSLSFGIIIGKLK